MTDMKEFYFSVMEKLPVTSYVRLVDIWLIFGQLIPFIEVITFYLLLRIDAYTDVYLFRLISRWSCLQFVKCIMKITLSITMAQRFLSTTIVLCAPKLVGLKTLT